MNTNNHHVEALIGYDSKSMSLVNGAGRRHYNNNSQHVTSFESPFIGSRNSSSRRHFDEQQKHSKIFTPETPRQPMKRSESLDSSHANPTLTELQEMKIQKKKEEAAEKRQTLEELMHYDPWGKPGGGAPNNLERPHPKRLNTQYRGPGYATSNSEYGNTAAMYPGFGNNFGNKDAQLNISRRLSADMDMHRNMQESDMTNDSIHYDPISHDPRSQVVGSANRRRIQDDTDFENEQIRVNGMRQYAGDLETQIRDKQNVQMKERQYQKQSFDSLAAQMDAGRKKWESPNRDLPPPMPLSHNNNHHTPRSLSKAGQQYSSMADLMQTTNNDSRGHTRRGSFSGRSNNQYRQDHADLDMMLQGKGRAYQAQDRSDPFITEGNGSRPSPLVQQQYADSDYPDYNQLPAANNGNFNNSAAYYQDRSADPYINGNYQDEDDKSSHYYAEQCRKFREEQDSYQKQFDNLRAEYELLKAKDDMKQLSGGANPDSGYENLAQEAEDRHRLRQLERLKDQIYSSNYDQQVNNYSDEREIPQDQPLYREAEQSPPNYYDRSYPPQVTSQSYPDPNTHMVSNQSPMPQQTRQPAHQTRYSANSNRSTNFYNGYEDGANERVDSRSSGQGPRGFRKGRLSDSLFGGPENGFNNVANAMRGKDQRPPVPPGRTPLQRRSSHSNGYESKPNSSAQTRSPYKVTAPFATDTPR